MADSEEMYPDQITTYCALQTIALTWPNTVNDCMKFRGIFPRLLNILAKTYVGIVGKFGRELQHVSFQLSVFIYIADLYSNKKKASRRILSSRYNRKLYRMTMHSPAHSLQRNLTHVPKLKKRLPHLSSQHQATIQTKKKTQTAQRMKTHRPGRI